MVLLLNVVLPQASLTVSSGYADVTEAQKLVRGGKVNPRGLLERKGNGAQGTWP